ncbi:hypothetical protein BC831DRAFT_482008 [Entophlyctis helioformis]|nr:hypothetical protein BC831DRAFT_482008 [Entophlyctis helioformis]
MTTPGIVLMHSDMADHRDRLQHPQQLEKQQQQQRYNGECLPLASTAAVASVASVAAAQRRFSTCGFSDAFWWCSCLDGDAAALAPVAARRTAATRLPQGCHTAYMDVLCRAVPGCALCAQALLTLCAVIAHLASLHRRGIVIVTIAATLLSLAVKRSWSLAQMAPGLNIANARAFADDSTASPLSSSSSSISSASADPRDLPPPPPPKSSSPSSLLPLAELEIGGYGAASGVWMGPSSSSSNSSSSSSSSSNLDPARRGFGRGPAADAVTAEAAASLAHLHALGEALDCRYSSSAAPAATPSSPLHSAPPLTPLSGAQPGSSGFPAPSTASASASGVAFPIVSGTLAASAAGWLGGMRQWTASLGSASGTASSNTGTDAPHRTLKMDPNSAAQFGAARPTKSMPSPPSSPAAHLHQQHHHYTTPPSPPLTASLNGGSGPGLLHNTRGEGVQVQPRSTEQQQYHQQCQQQAEIQRQQSLAAMRPKDLGVAHPDHPEKSLVRSSSAVSLFSSLMQPRRRPSIPIMMSPLPFVWEVHRSGWKGDAVMVNHNGDPLLTVSLSQSLLSMEMDVYRHSSKGRGPLMLAARRTRDSPNVTILGMNLGVNLTLTRDTVGTQYLFDAPDGRIYSWSLVHNQDGVFTGDLCLQRYPPPPNANPNPSSSRTAPGLQRNYYQMQQPQVPHHQRMSLDGSELAVFRVAQPMRLLMAPWMIGMFEISPDAAHMVEVVLGTGYALHAGLRYTS